MQHLEGSGTLVLYIGRTVLKVNLYRVTGHYWLMVHVHSCAT
jgi:hypothetical protein